MITWAALALAAIQLIASVLDVRRATRPQREVEAREQELRDDVDRTNRAIVDGDAPTLAQQFERERLEGAQRLVGGNDRLGTVRLLDRPADRDEPHS